MCSASRARTRTFADRGGCPAGRGGDESCHAEEGLSQRRESLVAGHADLDRSSEAVERLPVCSRDLWASEERSDRGTRLTIGHSKLPRQGPGIDGRRRCYLRSLSVQSPCDLGSGLHARDRVIGTMTATVFVGAAWLKIYERPHGAAHRYDAVIWFSSLSCAMRTTIGNASLIARTDRLR